MTENRAVEKRRPRTYICPKCGHESEDRRLQIQIREYVAGKYRVCESFTMDTVMEPLSLKQAIITLLVAEERKDKDD